MKITDYDIAKLQAELDAMEPDKQHGKKGVALSDAEAERKRLYNNLASRLSRAKKRKLEADKEAAFMGVEEIDEFGITDRDIRRYKQCYIFETILPSNEYIKRMTGLNDLQVEELNRRVKENILII